MPENLYGPRTFDFGLQGSPRTTAAVLSVSGTENPAGRPSDDCRNEPRFGGLLRYAHLDKVGRVKATLLIVLILVWVQSIEHSRWDVAAIW
jgi:hypothetical protein